MPSIRKYLAVIAVLVILPLAALAAFNWVVDPYDVFGNPRYQGLNAEKSRRHEFLKRAWTIYRGDAEAAIFGTSRSLAGLRADHPAWRPWKCVNLSISGSSIYQEMRYFQNAVAYLPLRRAVLAVEFYSFNVLRSPPPAFDERFLAVRDDGSVNPAAFVQILGTLLSWDTTSASIETIRRQGHVWRDTEPVLENFVRAERHMVKTSYFAPPSFDFATQDPRHNRNAFAHFERFVDLAVAHGIELTVLFSPKHARQEALISEAGLWGAYESWKRTIVEIVAKANRRAAAGKSVTVVDFTGFNAFTAEPLVSPVDGAPKAKMDWYLDGSHYNTKLGDKVLARVLARAPVAETDTDFGQPLTPQNLDAQLARIRAEKTAWYAAHQDAVAQISAQVKAYFAENRIQR